MDIEPEISSDYLPMDPKRLLERLHTAINTRDLTNLLLCLQVDYEQFFPDGSHKNTTGKEAARDTWEDIFRETPDLQADLLRHSFEGMTIWTEWHWHGKAPDGGFNRVGVIIFGVEEGLLAWSRSYMMAVRS